jgi:hypothetical protein
MDPTIVAAPANGRDLARAKSRILRLQRQHALPDIRRHLPAIPRRGHRLVLEQTGHPRRIEEIRLARQGALSNTGRGGTFRCGLAEQGDGPQDLVHLLLLPGDIEVNLVPLMRRLAALALRCRHRSPCSIAQGHYPFGG